MPSIALGVLFMRGSCCRNVEPTKKNTIYKYYVLIFTFLTYVMYHMSRKPFSVVKSELAHNCSMSNSSNHPHDKHWCDWAPFNADDSSELLGGLDSAFLFSYAVCMFFSGYFAERSNLRYYLTGGMLLSATSVLMFGLAYWLKIHDYAYYVFVMIFGGMVQTSGWPAVVNCVGNWFGKSKRGFIFGIWNAHTSIGNILGSYIAGLFVESDWGYSFAVPAFIMASFAVVVFLFLTPYPEDVGCESPNHPSIIQSSTESIPCEKMEDNSDSIEGVISVPVAKKADEASPMVNDSSTALTQSGSSSGKAVSLFGALKIPGVLEFSGCLFFSKLVSYTFLYWLPRYINATDKLSPETSANLSTAFDFGGMLGGIIAGLVSDATGGSATICILMLLLSTPMLYGYKYFAMLNMAEKFCYLFATGVLVNGPYALITTAVAAELGTSSVLRGSSRALSTVTAIIDGTGSMGAAVGPLLAGFLAPTGWEKVFYMLMASSYVAALVVVRISIKEILRFFNKSEVRCCCCTIKAYSKPLAFNSDKN